MNIRTKSDFIIVAISVLVFSTTRVIYSLLIINWNNYEKGNVTPSFLFWIDFISYFVVFSCICSMGGIFEGNLLKKIKIKEIIPYIILLEYLLLFMPPFSSYLLLFLL